MPKRRRSLRLPLLDAHYDGIILREVRGDSLDLTRRAPLYHADLPRFKRGNVSVLMAMVGDHDLHQSARLIDGVISQCARYPDQMTLCLTRQDVDQAVAKGRLGLVMSIEGQVMFAENAGLLRNWIRLGVRVASLTHGEGRFLGPHATALQYDPSHFGYLTPSQRRLLRRQTKGLTPFAYTALDVLAESGIPCDVAHVNEAAFWQVLEYVRGPVCYTHGACYELCPHSRNLTDDMMRALAAREGVMGIALYPSFISQTHPSLDALCEHVLHALDVMGPDHVGIGTDFDGMDPTMEPVLRCPELPRLWTALKNKGIAHRTLEKIAWRNFARLLPA